MGLGLGGWRRVGWGGVYQIAPEIILMISKMIIFHLSQRGARRSELSDVAGAHNHSCHHHHCRLYHHHKRLKLQQQKSFGAVFLARTLLRILVGRHLSSRWKMGKVSRMKVEEVRGRM